MKCSAHTGEGHGRYGPNAHTHNTARPPTRVLVLSNTSPVICVRYPSSVGSVPDSAFARRSISLRCEPQLIPYQLQKLMDVLIQELLLIQLAPLVLM